MHIIKCSRSITRAIKYCKKTFQRIRCNQFSFVFSLLFIIHLILPLQFLLRVRPDIFIAFNYTIVLTLSQLIKKTTKKHLQTDIFHVLFKNIFLVVNASNLIIRIPLERKLKNSISKIYLIAKVSYFLKNDIVKLQNTEN